MAHMQGTRSCCSPEERRDPCQALGSRAGTRFPGKSWSTLIQVLACRTHLVFLAEAFPVVYLLQESRDDACMQYTWEHMLMHWVHRMWKHEVWQYQCVHSVTTVDCGHCIMCSVVCDCRSVLRSFRNPSTGLREVSALIQERGSLLPSHSGLCWTLMKFAMFLWLPRGAPARGDARGQVLHRSARNSTLMWSLVPCAGMWLRECEAHAQKEGHTWVFSRHGVDVRDDTLSLRRV